MSNNYAQLRQLRRRDAAAAERCAARLLAMREDLAPLRKRKSDGHFAHSSAQFLRVGYYAPQCREQIAGIAQPHESPPMAMPDLRQKRNCSGTKDRRSSQLRPMWP